MLHFSCSSLAMPWYGGSQSMLDNRLAKRVGTPSSWDLAWELGRWTGGPPVDLVFVQDDSASMYRAAHDDPPALRPEAARLTVSLLEGARAAFIAFGAADRGCAIPLQRISCDEDRRTLMARIEAATYEKGGTDYADGLRSVIDALVEGDAAYGWPPYRAEGHAVGVLFMSDGQPGVDPDRVPDRRRLDELRSEGGPYERLRERGWPVFTIGVGRAANDAEAAGVLSEMAEATGGRPFVAATVHGLLEACAAVVAGLSGCEWTSGGEPEPVPVSRRFELRTGSRSATFVAVKSAPDQVLRVIDPGGREVRGRRRVRSTRFELVAVTAPRGGGWTAVVEGTGQASLGILTDAAPGLPGSAR